MTSFFKRKMFYINFVFKVNFLNKQKNSCENCKKKTIYIKKNYESLQSNLVCNFKQKKSLMQKYFLMQ